MYICNEFSYDLYASRPLSANIRLPARPPHRRAVYSIVGSPIPVPRICLHRACGTGSAPRAQTHFLLPRASASISHRISAIPGSPSLKSEYRESNPYSLAEFAQFPQIFYYKFIIDYLSTMDFWRGCFHVVKDHVINQYALKVRPWRCPRYPQQCESQPLCIRPKPHRENRAAPCILRRKTSPPPEC